MFGQKTALKAMVSGKGLQLVKYEGWASLRVGRGGGWGGGGVMCPISEFYKKTVSLERDERFWKIHYFQGGRNISFKKAAW